MVLNWVSSHLAKLSGIAHAFLKAPEIGPRNVEDRTRTFGQLIGIIPMRFSMFSSLCNIYEEF